MVRLRTEFLWVGVWPHERVICQIIELRTNFTSDEVIFLPACCERVYFFNGRTDFCCVTQLDVHVDCGFCWHTCVINDNMLLIKAPGRSIWSTPLNWGAGLRTGQRVSMLTVCLCPGVCLWIPEDLYGEVWVLRAAAFRFSTGRVFGRFGTSIETISSGISCSKLKREGVEKRWKQRQLCKYPRGKGILGNGWGGKRSCNEIKGNLRHICGCWKVEIAGYHYRDETVLIWHLSYTFVSYIWPKMRVYLVYLSFSLSRSCRHILGRGR